MAALVPLAATGQLARLHPVTGVALGGGARGLLRALLRGHAVPRARLAPHRRWGRPRRHRHHRRRRNSGEQARHQTDNRHLHDHTPVLIAQLFAPPPSRGSSQGGECPNLIRCRLQRAPPVLIAGRLRWRRGAGLYVTTSRRVAKGVERGIRDLVVLQADAVSGRWHSLGCPGGSGEARVCRVAERGRPCAWPRRYTCCCAGHAPRLSSARCSKVCAPCRRAVWRAWRKHSRAPGSWPSARRASPRSRCSSAS